MSAIASAALRSQAGFRNLMQALAQPGTLFSVDALPRPAPAIGNAAATAILTLCDFETPLHLARSLAADTSLADWIRFETGAPIVHEPARAAFAIADPSEDVISLDGYAQGTADYPDRSTTVILLCGALDSGALLTLSGPGIRTTQAFRPDPWPEALGRQWLENRQRFPLGVDLVLCSGDKLAALPRSTRIHEGAG